MPIEVSTCIHSPCNCNYRSKISGAPSIATRLEVSTDFRVPVIGTGGQLKYPESLSMRSVKASRVSVISTKDQRQYQGSQSLPLENVKVWRLPFLHLEVSHNIQSPRHSTLSSVKVSRVPIISVKVSKGPVLATRYQLKKPESTLLPLGVSTRI